jgi:hypothetical protein
MTVRAEPAAPAHGGPADVVYVLTLLQVAAGLLAMLGELLLMGGRLFYLPVPLAKAVLLLVLAAKISGGRRWAMIAMIINEGLAVLGFWAGALIGMLPQLDHTITLVGLLTGLALPVGVTYLCVTLLARTPRRRRPAPPVRPMCPGPPQRPAPPGPAVDPWPGAPVTDGLVLPAGLRS